MLPEYNFDYAKARPNRFVKATSRVVIQMWQKYLKRQKQLTMRFGQLFQQLQK
jgi:hypothetical protein